MVSVENNMKVISVEKEFGSKFGQVADKYFANEINK
jgi:hypothetical protein